MADWISVRAVWYLSSGAGRLDGTTGTWVAAESEFERPALGHRYTPPATRASTPVTTTIIPALPPGAAPVLVSTAGAVGRVFSGVVATTRLGKALPRNLAFNSATRWG